MQHTVFIGGILQRKAATGVIDRADLRLQIIANLKTPLTTGAYNLSQHTAGQ